MKKLKTLFKANKIYLSYIAKNQKLYLTLQIIIILLNIPLTLLNMYAPKNFLNSVVYANSLKTAMYWIGAMLGGGLLFYLLRTLVGSYNEHVRSKAKLAMKIATYKRYNELYLSYFEDNKKMDNANRAFEYTDNGCNEFFLFLVRMGFTLGSLATASFISLQFDWWLWIMLVAVFVIKILINGKSKKIKHIFNREQAARSRIIRYFPRVFDSKGSLAEVKIYNADEYFLEKFKSAWIRNLIVRIPHNIKMAFIYFIEEGAETVLQIVCYLVIGIKLYQGNATIGDYTLFFAMINQITWQLDNLQWNLSNVYEYALTAQNYIDFMEDTGDCMHTEKSESELTSVSGIENIEIKDLTFKYHNQVRPALDGISLSIKRGEKISIVGLNGAGKTTLIKLILLLYKPESGEICINGIPASDLNSKEYWNRTGVVFQNYGTYSVSVADNLVFGDEEARARLPEILEKVGILEKIDGLPKKLDTLISQELYPDGINFSGGEQQRLAIARAFARDADLYIFDEPSSNLDAKAEDALYEIINAVPDDKTVIFISHRLSSVSSTNRIIVINEGKIIGDGKHSYLMSSCPEYRDMYETQARRYGAALENTSEVS